MYDVGANARCGSVVSSTNELSTTSVGSSAGAARRAAAPRSSLRSAPIATSDSSLPCRSTRPCRHPGLRRSRRPCERGLTGPRDQTDTCRSAALLDEPELRACGSLGRERRRAFGRSTACGCEPCCARGRARGRCRARTAGRRACAGSRARGRSAPRRRFGVAVCGGRSSAARRSGRASADPGTSRGSPSPRRSRRPRPRADPWPGARRCSGSARSRASAGDPGREGFRRPRSNDRQRLLEPLLRCERRAQRDEDLDRRSLRGRALVRAPQPPLRAASDRRPGPRSPAIERAVGQRRRRDDRPLSRAIAQARPTRASQRRPRSSSPRVVEAARRGAQQTTGRQGDAGPSSSAARRAFSHPGADVAPRHETSQRGQARPRPS